MGTGRKRWLQCALLVVVLLCAMSEWTAGASKQKTREITVPEYQLEGGRKLTYESSIRSDRDVRPKPGFFTKVLDLVIGGPDLHFLVRPYSVVTDSRGRIIVTDPGAAGVHVFDFSQHKYKFIERREKEKDFMRAPQCVAVDEKDNIYVTDSESGKIFVFDANGKYERAVGSLKGGEGYFKRPTGIAVDSAAQRIYVTDTLRNKVYVMDMQGSVLQTIGKPGQGDGEFNFPTELRLLGSHLIVVDAMNFRVQVFDRAGTFQFAIGNATEELKEMFRPKAVGVDSEGHLYVVDGFSGVVQVFNRQGQMLYYFGKRGTAEGEFQLPAGMFIDGKDRIFVADSFNHRIQVFHYFGLNKVAEDGIQ